MSEDLTKEILERDNRDLREQVESLQAVLNRPVTVQIQQPEPPDLTTLKKVADYLPQLTHISTNLSHVASAVQSVNATLTRIEVLMQERRGKDERP